MSEGRGGGFESCISTLGPAVAAPHRSDRAGESGPARPTGTSEGVGRWGGEGGGGCLTNAQYTTCPAGGKCPGEREGYMNECVKHKFFARQKNKKMRVIVIKSTI